jgi:hypothetical protein
LNPASARGVLDIGLKSLGLENIGETMNMGFFLRIASEVADGAGKMMADNFDQETVDFYPAWEFTRLDEVEVPRGTEVVKGVVQTWNGWDDPDGRWVAACDESGDDDALQVFHDTGRMVALKSSGVWAALGAGAGGYTDCLGNSFPPFAFNSGMYRDNVSRHEAVELGLMDDLDENGVKTVAEPAKMDFADLLNFDATGKLAASLAHRALMAGAPIGNQNARKWDKQTDTPEFRAWFGNSKVVDKDGKPLVVYHGTHKDIESFKGGSHFGSQQQSDRAMRYGSDSIYRDNVPLYKSGMAQYPAFIRIENPMRVEDPAADFDQGRTPRQKWASLISKAKHAGHDGIVYENQVEGKGDSWVIFDPTQIKSAIGNKGTWSKTDPRITARAAREAASLLALEARFTAKGFTIEAGEGVPA